MHPLVLLTWLVASTPGEAQAPGEPRTVSEFLLIRKNGDRIEGRSGSLTATRFTGISADGQQLELLPDDIGTLYRKAITQAQVFLFEDFFGSGTARFETPATPLVVRKAESQPVAQIQPSCTDTPEFKNASPVEKKRILEKCKQAQ